MGRRSRTFVHGRDRRARQEFATGPRCALDRPRERPSGGGAAPHGGDRGGSRRKHARRLDRGAAAPGAICRGPGGHRVPPGRRLARFARGGASRNPRDRPGPDRLAAAGLRPRPRRGPRRQFRRGRRPQPSGGRRRRTPPGGGAARGAPARSRGAPRRGGRPGPVPRRRRSRARPVRWTTNDVEARRAGAAAQAVVEQRRGVSERVARALLELLR